MPKLTQADIEKHVAEGKIKLITLDTNILKQYNYGLEYGLLSRMAQFEATDVNVVMSEIVVQEIVRAHDSRSNRGTKRVQKSH